MTKEQVIAQLYLIIEHFESYYDTDGIYLYKIEALKAAINMLEKIEN